MPNRGETFLQLKVSLLRSVLFWAFYAFFETRNYNFAAMYFHDAKYIKSKFEINLKISPPYILYECHVECDAERWNCHGCRTNPTTAVDLTTRQCARGPSPQGPSATRRRFSSASSSTAGALCRPGAVSFSTVIWGPGTNAVCYVVN